MARGGYSLGGEQSGHIIFSKYARTGDGVLTSIMIMQAMIDQKATLSALVAPMKIYPQVLKNLRVKDKKSAREDKDVCEIVAAVEERLGDRGRVLVRESGTEPVIRVMVEAESKEICEEMVESIVKVINAKGYL